MFRDLTHWVSGQNDPNPALWLARAGEMALYCSLSITRCFPAIKWLLLCQVKGVFYKPSWMLASSLFACLWNLTPSRSLHPPPPPPRKRTRTISSNWPITQRYICRHKHCNGFSYTFLLFKESRVVKISGFFWLNKQTSCCFNTDSFCLFWMGQFD